MPARSFTITIPLDALHVSTTGDWTFNTVTNPDRWQLVGSTGTLNLIVSGGDSLTFSGSGILPPTTVAAAPAGFTPTTDLLLTIPLYSGGNFLHYDIHYANTQLLNNTSAFSYQIPANTPWLDIWIGFISIVAGTPSGGDNILLDNEGNNAFITGSYIISAQTWFFNPVTNHFRFEDETDPWIPQDPVLNVVSVYPPAGCGATDVTIHGTGFGDGAAVLFDNIPAANIVVVDSEHITCTVPAHADGPVDVTVINVDANSDTAIGAYIYGTPYWIKEHVVVLGNTHYSTVNLGLPVAVIAVDPPGVNKDAGSDFTIVGAGFQEGATATLVSGDNRTAIDVVFVDSGTLTGITPDRPFKGTVTIIVTNPDGSSGALEVTNTVDVFLLNEVVQACDAPDGDFAFYQLTTPTNFWWVIPAFQFHVHQPYPPSDNWIVAPAPPGMNGWYFSTNNFDGNVFITQSH